MRIISVVAGLGLAAGVIGGLVPASAQACSATQLKGAWSLEMTPDSGSPSGAIGQVLHGELALLSSGWAARGSLVPGVQPDKLYGLFDVDFELLGPSFRLHSALPITSGVIAGDSVEVDLLPQVDHGGFVLRGGCGNDSVTGRWYQKRPGGLQGVFSMRKL